MNFQKETIRTSVLTTATVGVVVFTLLLVGIPGFFHKQYEVAIYFDNASGIQQGANVMVAGRKVGFVSSIASPLPPDQRPEGHPEMEVKIIARVDQTNQIYRDASAVMLQQGLLGSMVIDFVRGSPADGFAENGTTYIGTRRPDFTEAIPALLDAIQPVAESAEEALGELKEAAKSLETLLATDGPIAETLGGIRSLADNLAGITAPEGALTLTLTRFGNFADELTDKQGPLQLTLTNLQTFTAQLADGEKIALTLDRVEQAAARLDATLGQTQSLLHSIQPTLEQTLLNTEQMTDTLKRQPWRIIWPATKEYPEEIRRAEPVQPLPAPTPRNRPRGPLR